MKLRQTFNPFGDLIWNLGVAGPSPNLALINAKLST